jgi:hypothetical protein
MPSSPLPLVAVLAGQLRAELPQGLRGIAAEGLVAVLAPPEMPGARTMPDRREAARRALVRQRLLESLMPCGDVLAAAPDQLLGPSDVPGLFASNADRLRSALAEVRGRVQYQLLVGWDEAGVLARFRDSPAVAALRTRGTVAGVDILRAVGAVAASLAAEVQSVMEGIGAEMIALPRPADTPVHLVLLVEAARVGALDGALERIDAIWPEGLRIRLIGPGPAVSFALLEIEQVSEDRLAAAARCLELPWPVPPIDLAAARKAALRIAAGRTQGPSADEIESAVDVIALARRHTGAAPLRLIRIRRDGPAATALARVA